MEDHDLLIRIDAEVKNIKRDLCNHLKHHFVFAITLLTITLGAILTALTALLK